MAPEEAPDPRPSLPRDAATESIWGTLRLVHVYRGDFATRHRARAEIFDYNEAFHNRERIHTALHGFSPTRRGNCYDNAAMESFWSTLKIELAYRRDFGTHRQTKAEIFDYIELFYNRQRIHTSLDGLSPSDFELTNN